MSSEISEVRNRSLTERTIRASIWAVSSVGVQYILRILLTAVLARLLSPEDFGLLAATGIILQFFQLLSQMGVGPAIIQREDLQEIHLRVGFTFSILFTSVLAILIWLLAPWFAQVFYSANMVWILRTVVFSVALLGISLVPEALLQRKLKFRKLTEIEIVSFILGYALFGVVLAALGFGVWALVCAVIAQNLWKT